MSVRGKATAVTEQSLLLKQKIATGRSPLEARYLYIWNEYKNGEIASTVVV